MWLKFSHKFLCWYYIICNTFCTKLNTTKHYKHCIFISGLRLVDLVVHVQFSFIAFIVIWHTNMVTYFTDSVYLEMCCQILVLKGCPIKAADLYRLCCLITINSLKALEKSAFYRPFFWDQMTLACSLVCNFFLNANIKFVMMSIHYNSKVPLVGLF